MEYTSDLELGEIMKRRDRILKKREKKRTLLLSCCVSVLLVLLVVGIVRLPGAGSAGSGVNQTVLGSFLLSSSAGGYILTAVIAFVLGVAVTLVCFRIRKRRNRPGSGNREDGI